VLTAGVFTSTPGLITTVAAELRVTEDAWSSPGLQVDGLLRALWIASTHQHCDQRYNKLFASNCASN